VLGLMSFISQLPPELRGNVIKPYYNPGSPAQSAAIGAGQSVTFTYLAKNVVMFGALAVVGRAWIDGAVDTAVSSPPLTINLTSSGGDFLTNGDVLWDSIVVTPAAANLGLGGLPQVWLQDGNSIVTAEVSVIAGAASLYWVEVDLVGNNVYNLLTPEAERQKAAAAAAAARGGR